MFNLIKKQGTIFSWMILLGLLFASPISGLAETQELTQDAQIIALPLEVVIPSTYTVTIPQKLAFQHLETGKQYLKITVDAKLQDDEQVQLTAVNATPDGLVGLTNGQDILNVEHRRAADDSKITSSNAIIDIFKTGKTTHVSVVQASDWNSITTGGIFRGNFSYSVKVVKEGA